MKRAMFEATGGEFRGAAILAAVLLTGCSSFVMEPGRSNRLLTPRSSSEIAVALAGANGVGTSAIEIEIVDIPGLSSWPRSLRAAGPMYALFQLQPYVGQFGVIRDQKRADSGLGFGLVFGHRKPMSGAKSLGLEFIFERSGHTNESSAVDATATRLLGAARMNLNMDKELTPFIVAGGGMYSLKFDGLDPKFNLSGLGFMAGGGVDFSPKRNLAVRAELVLHIWDAAQEDGAGGMAETLTLGVGAALSF